MNPANFPSLPPPPEPSTAVAAGVSSARKRVALFAVAALLLGLMAVDAAPAFTQTPTPEGCAQPNRHMNLYAEVIAQPGAPAQSQLGYGLAPGEATRPGPLIEMVEGECLAITLHNNVPAEHIPHSTGAGSTQSRPVGVSLHVHGVKYTIESDGTFHSDSVVPSVPPGQSRTYIWFAAPRQVRGRNVISSGTAGYWWYHDHNVGTDHGTAGISRGLAGGLVVRRPGDPQPDRTYTTVFHNNNLLNWASYPATDTCDPMNPQPSNSCFIANKGELVEFVNISIGEFTHTWHLHGHNWAKTRTGIANWDRFDETPLEDNRIMASGDSFGFMINAGQHVGAASWMLHCHVESHANLGMSTFFHVLDANGQIPHNAHHMTPGFENLDAGSHAEHADEAASRRADAHAASAARKP